ncbi:MAG: GAF domain-containing protein [Chloroflexi bacterium]|nr:MAG: GAF domain-containing protein [Chloroflexota bacterium]
MSDISRRSTSIADAVATIPGWFRPRRFSRGPGAVAATTLCILFLALVLAADLSTPGLSLGALAILPVVAAAWLLSGRLAALVAGLAILNRVLSGALGGVPPLQAGAEVVTLGLVAAVGRVAGAYLAATRSAGERSDLLARVARIATSADSIQQILDRILQEMAREGLRGGLIGLIDERGEIYAAAAEGDIDEAVWNSRIPVGEGIMGTAAAEGRSILVRDLDAPDLPVPPVNRALGSNSRIKSLVVVPLLAAGKVVGVLELDSDRPNRFDERDLALLEQVALAISKAVQREGALQLADDRVKRRVEELTILLDAARSLGASVEPELVQAAVVRTVTHVLRAENGRAALIRVEDSRLTALSEFIEDSVRTRDIDFPLAFAPAEMLRAIETGHAYGCRRDQVDAGLAGYLGPQARAFAWAPVRIGNQLYGVVVASSEGALFEWPALRMLEGVADLAGLAVGNAERLRLELERSSELTAHAERMAELEKVKSDFLKVASHELRGPLAVLKGYISMLSDGSIGPEHPATPRILEVVNGKLGEVSELVEQMLETARLEDSQLHLQLDRQDLRELLAEALERVRPRALPTHRLLLLEPDAPVSVLADRGRALTILANLLDNAIKYSPGGDRPGRPAAALQPLRSDRDLREQPHPRNRAGALPGQGAGAHARGRDSRGVEAGDR